MNSENLRKRVVTLLDETLKLNGRLANSSEERLLLGDLPEMDSLGAVGVIAAIENKFQITIDDDEIDGSVFQTLGSLTHFIEDKVCVGVQ